MEPINKLPGLTFYVEHSKLKDKHGSVLLSASVEDPELWEATVKKLDNFRVYSVNDLSTAMIQVLQEENKEVRESNSREMSILREKLERAEQQLSVYRVKEVEESRLTSELKQLVKRLRELES